MVETLSAECFDKPIRRKNLPAGFVGNPNAPRALRFPKRAKRDRKLPDPVMNQKAGRHTKAQVAMDATGTSFCNYGIVEMGGSTLINDRSAVRIPPPLVSLRFWCVSWIE
jgi:hypothetical protein